MSGESAPEDEMHHEYFETCFRLVPGVTDVDWPAKFAIVSAYATTGERWPEARNIDADRELETELRSRSVWMQRVVGFSPTSGHAEPSWAAELSFESACDLGLRVHQDAIYFIDGDELSVSFCDARRKPIRVGLFRERLRAHAE